MTYKVPLTKDTDFGSMKVGSGLVVIDGVVSTSNEGVLNYGFAVSSTTQNNPISNNINLVTFDSIGPANGISIGVGGNNLIVTNSGIYTVQYNFNVNKTSGGTSNLSTWLRKSGTDIVGSRQELQLTNTLSQVPISGNYTLNLVAGNNIQICWSSSDSTLTLIAIPSGIIPTRPTGYAVKVTLTSIS